MIGFDDIEKWAEPAAIVVAGACAFGMKFVRRLRRNRVLEPLHIGGTGPELRLNARVTEIERSLKALAERTDERHEQNEGNFQRLFASGEELQKMVGAISRRLFRD